MRRAQGARQIAHAGRVAPLVVADERRHPGLIEGHPVVDPVAEHFECRAGEVGETARGVATGPAAVAILERLRQVPVVERRHRADATLEKAVDKPLVEVEAGLVAPPIAIGKQARPGDAEAVRRQAEVGHQVDVRLESTVVVVCDVAGRPVFDVARRVAEPVPDRLAPTVGADAPFDLVTGRRRAPQEARREGH